MTISCKIDCTSASFSWDYFCFHPVLVDLHVGTKYWMLRPSEDNHRRSEWRSSGTVAAILEHWTSVMWRWSSEMSLQVLGTAFCDQMAWGRLCLCRRSAREANLWRASSSPKKINEVQSSTPLSKYILYRSHDAMYWSLPHLFIPCQIGTWGF